MPVKRVLLFYISINSGHQMAAMAVEESIHIQNRDVETLNVNYFKYTNPVLAGLIMKTYHGMLKRSPGVWDYLYDNENVRKKTEKFRNLLHRSNSAKIKKLLEWYKPDVIVCTQAFPCVALAEYKRTYKIDVPIVGVVTDYGVHSYWADRNVDLYFVPNCEAKERLVELGIENKKIEISGIPVLPKFSLSLDRKKLMQKFNLDPQKPVVLLMGGSQGMVLIDEIIKHLMKVPIDIQMIVVCGSNKVLYKNVKKIDQKLKGKLRVYQYVNNIEELMTVSDMVVTKPGGLTVSEALVKNLPLIIVNPIPGQEAKNTDYLLKENAAVKALDTRDAARRIGDLISSSNMLKQLKQAVRIIARPKASFEIAERIINWN